MSIKINDTLSIAPFELSDKQALLSYMSDADQHRNTLRLPNPYLEKDADEWIARCMAEPETQGHTVNWAIRHTQHGLVGGIGCMQVTGWEGHRDEIGYWMAAPFRGQGWMTLAVRAFCEYLSAQRPGLVRIEALVFSYNPASGRVLEKAGFVKEGEFKRYHLKNNQPIDVVVYGKLLGE